jgi:hypothetical protein
MKGQKNELFAIISMSPKTHQALFHLKSWQIHLNPNRFFYIDLIGYIGHLAESVSYT